MNFLTKDDVNLAFKIDKHHNEYKGSIIITHGICEHLGRYNYITNKLVDAGYDVYRYDLRGHGDSEGKKGNVDNYQRFISDLDQIVDFIRLKKKEVFILGHSMGGLISNAYAATYPKKIRGLISSGAPGTKLRSAAILYRIPYKPIKYLNIKNRVGDDLCTVKEVRTAYANDPKVLKKTKVNLLGTMFVDCIKYLQNNVKNIICPVVYLHGKEDKIVDKESSEWLYENVSSQDKEIHIYENLCHEILNETSKDDIIDTIITWLNNH